MRTKFLGGLFALMLSAAAHAQLPVITSFSGNGILICSNLFPQAAAVVEWAPTPSGPWTSSWAALAAVVADTNGAIKVSVPMFYRVRGIPPLTNGMALIPAGSFTMGNYLLNGSSVTNDPDITDATPATVNVSAFYMDANLVTSNLWQTVYNGATNIGYTFRNPGSSSPTGDGANYPIRYISWPSAVEWCNARSQLTGLKPVYYTDAGLSQVFTNNSAGGTPTIYANWTASGYRLPTEAEWEKAARGGLTGQRFPLGNTISESQATYEGDPADYSYDLGPSGFNPLAGDGVAYSTPVGSFEANGYGLNDMAGNVLEWCWDWYAAPSYPAGSPYLGGSDPAVRQREHKKLRVVAMAENWLCMRDVLTETPKMSLALGNQPRVFGV